MEIITRAPRLRSVAAKLAAENKSIGLVPTMGALHEGHLQMIREAQRMTDVVIVTIFVNPQQFKSEAALRAYPRDLAQDMETLKPLGVDYVFTPSETEMYPDGFASWVEVGVHDHELEGAQRPDHFRGAATVLTIYFNLVHPKFVFMGQKDAQQTIIAKKMVRDLHSPVEIIVTPIVREADGVAVSSRNAHLTPEQRKALHVMPRALRAAEQLFNQGERHAGKLVKAMRKELDAEPLARVDYIAVTDTEHLDPLDDVKDKASIISLAVYFGDTRLIDNLILNDMKFKARAGIRLGEAKT
ncbi:MAG: pantoate--beta-alanine ligase [Acidobacteria bacterium]|nr:pantoate--beta-alanine ligase [Acidobacteriota bacterium]